MEKKCFAKNVLLKNLKLIDCGKIVQWQKRVAFDILRSYQTINFECFGKRVTLDNSLFIKTVYKLLSNM